MERLFEMSHFDTPNTGYGTYYHPEMVFTFVNESDLSILKELANELEINYERWFFTGKAGVIEEEALHEKIELGIIVYYPQYNCLRNGGHIADSSFTGVPLLPFDIFLTKLRKHPKKLGSFFIKTPSPGHREVIFTWFKMKGYNLDGGQLFDHETAVLINEPLKLLIAHRPERADENAEAGYYPVMTYEDFKIYMQ